MEFLFLGSVRTLLSLYFSLFVSDVKHFDMNDFIIIFVLFQAVFG